LRAEADEMIGHEESLSRAADERAQSATRFSRLLFIAGFLLALLLQGMAFFMVVREVNQRREAEEAVHELNRQLEVHIRELDVEIAERKKVEAEVHQLNDQLSAQVDLLNETNTTLNAVNRELESFAYSVSHDLRSPLRGLDGLSLALLEDYGDRIDDVGKGFLTRMRSESQRMGQLIDGILSLSRLTRGEFHPQPVNLSEMAAQILEELKADEPDRRVNADVEPGLATKADPRLMEAVLQNLLDNAWKFTSRHESGRIQFGSEKKDGKTVYFVKDDGAGFDMAYIGKMFGAFQRLHGAQDFPGTGIGLATVQRIIHRHGGTIWAEGAIEQGASFYFTLN
jgi:light-regulated signal transduction histidine kinase (bacteriophytochrome)